MERIIYQYRRLLQLLEEEEKSIHTALSDEPLRLYLDAIRAEQEKLEKHIAKLKQIETTQGGMNK